MDDLLARIWADLVGRLHGPLTFRLVLQPLVAGFLAIRSGLRDGREGRPAYFWAILTDAGARRSLLREGWKDITRIFVLAVAIDVVYQVIVFHTVYPGEALIVAVILACIPYLLIRGPVTRLSRRKKRT